MKPMDALMAAVEWEVVDGAKTNDDGIPYATHSGVLNIMGQSLRVYRLNTGQAIINADDLDAFFGGAA